MANNINISNFDRPNILAQAQLTQDTAAGVNSLPVGNSASFAAGGYVLIGNVGSSTAELKTSNATASGTAIPLASTTALAHSFNDFVTLLFGNQINVYRADDEYGNGTQPTDDKFAKIATINITPNSALTAYSDTAGTTGQWYKFTYYSQAASAETPLASSRAVRPGAVHFVSLDQVRDAAGFSNNPNVTDDIVAEKRDAAEKEINGALQSVYELPLPEPTNPIIVTIAKNIAGGELMAEMYTGVSPEKVVEGNAKAAKGRAGNEEDGTIGILQLVEREVVLQDANYIDLTNRTTSGVSGYPDATVTGFSTRTQGGGDQLFWPGMRY